MFRRNRERAALSSSSNHGSQNSRDGGCCRWLTCPNPITTGLLLYIVFFQSTLYRSKDDALVPATAAIYPLATSSSDCGQQQQQQLQPPERRVGVWHRRAPVTPVNPVEWKPHSDQIIKLPYPIFLTSLPKSGTTSAWKFFRCGKQKASHNWIQKRGSTQSTAVGLCIEENIKAGRPPFDDCGEVDIYTDTGVSELFFTKKSRVSRTDGPCLSPNFFFFVVPQLRSR